MQLDFDLDAGALYVKLSEQPVASTREAGSNAHVDLAADGSLVGIEVIALGHSWPLEEIVSAYRMPTSERRQLCGYFAPQWLIAVDASAPLPEPPQLTSSQDLPVQRTPVLTTA